MIDQDLQNILSLVDQYITKKHNSKEWAAGQDWVQYAGPYFSSLEYTKAIDLSDFEKAIYFLEI